MKSLLIYDGDYRNWVAMAKAKKSKDADIEKLRHILDTNGKVDDDEVDELLKSVELRLKGKKKPVSSKKSSSKRPEYMSTKSRNLEPSVSVGSLNSPKEEEQQPASEPVQGSCIIDPPSFNPDDFKVKDLYEIVYPLDDEPTLFVEVKTKPKQLPLIDQQKTLEPEEKKIEPEPIKPVEKKQEPKKEEVPIKQEEKKVEEEVLEEWKLVEEPLPSSKKESKDVSVVSKTIVKEEKADEEKKAKLSLKGSLKLPKREKKEEKPIVKAKFLVEKEEENIKEEKVQVPEKPAADWDKKNRVFLKAFEGMSCIDEKTAGLLHENNITSPSDIVDTKISDLTKIKGIRRKLAKEMKKQAGSLSVEGSASVRTVSSAIKRESTEWVPDESEDTCVTKEKVEEKEAIKKEPAASVQDPVDKDVLYSYGEYGLYKKEMVTSTGKAREIHFFSKTKPDVGEPVNLPDGYEVKVNKKTGLPSLKKKKK